MGAVKGSATTVVMKTATLSRIHVSTCGVTLMTCALLILLAPWPSVASPEARGDESPEMVDMRPERPAAWGGRYVLAPLVALFRGPSYMYAPRKIEVETTPAAGYVDLFYVRSGFQKRFEQAQTPLQVLLPSRVEIGPRDSLTIRAFADGYRQRSVTIKISSGVERVAIDLDPLPNRLEALSYRYFAGRASLSFLTSEAAVFRLQQADDGFSVILNETALSAEVREVLEEIRSPLIREAYAQQLGEDLMLRIVLEPSQQGDVGPELRSRQEYEAPRDLYAFHLDLVPRDGGVGAVRAARAALDSLQPGDVSGCALRFDDSLRRQLDAGELARALVPRGTFVDRYLRAAMRRLGELSVDGVVDFSDASRFRPGVAMELEMSLSKAHLARGFLALLRGFSARLEATPEHRRQALRSLIAPELGAAAFEAHLQEAEAAEARCKGS